MCPSASREGRLIVANSSPPIENFYPNTEFFFLSNFYDEDETLAARLWDYPTTEHYYQAMKTQDLGLRARFKDPTLKPGRAKSFGRDLDLRPHWDEGLKDEVMAMGLEHKFAAGTSLANRLVLTGDRYLIEGNYWHDLYWGICTGNCRQGSHAPLGENKLGLALMKRRTELQEEG